MVAVEDENKNHLDSNDDQEVIGVEEHEQSNKMEVSDHNQATSNEKTVDLPTTKESDAPAIQQLTVEELYDKDKYDLSTMEPGDVFVLLQ